MASVIRWVRLKHKNLVFEEKAERIGRISKRLPFTPGVVHGMAAYVEDICKRIRDNLTALDLDLAIKIIRGLESDLSLGSYSIYQPTEKKFTSTLSAARLVREGEKRRSKVAGLA